MKTTKLTDAYNINIGASTLQIEALQQIFNDILPEKYIFLLKEVNGFMLNNGVKVYSTDDLPERNETLEVREYAPNYVAIGDDSGGLSIMLDLMTGGVFSVDQGSMSPKDMEKLANNIDEWLATNCDMKQE